jgi:hypothetical protein
MTHRLPDRLPRLMNAMFSTLLPSAERGKTGVKIKTGDTQLFAKVLTVAFSAIT